MEIMRLVVTGAVGAGKSTFVRSASEIQVVDVESRTTTQASALKDKFTIALDYGRVNLSPNIAIHLYGTPGQVRFDFIWDLLIRRSHACIVLVAANRPGGFRNASRLLAFMEARVQIPLMIGITHTDCPGAWSMEDVTIALGYAHQKKQPKMMRVNPNQKTSVVQALLTSVEQCNPTKALGCYIKKPIAA